MLNVIDRSGVVRGFFIGAKQAAKRDQDRGQNTDPLDGPVCNAAGGAEAGQVEGGVHFNFLSAERDGFVSHSGGRPGSVALPVVFAGDIAQRGGIILGGKPGSDRFAQASGERRAHGGGEGWSGVRSKKQSWRDGRCCSFQVPLSLF